MGCKNHVAGGVVAYDLLFAYAAFEGPLPPTLRAWCAALRALFPPGFCVLILSIRPADAHMVWAITVLMALVLLGASPLFFYLAAVWHGPENPAAQFGSGNPSARMFNGGDAILGTSYLLLGLCALLL